MSREQPEAAKRARKEGGQLVRPPSSDVTHVGLFLLNCSLLCCHLQSQLWPWFDHGQLKGDVLHHRGVQQPGLLGSVGHGASLPVGELQKHFFKKGIQSLFVSYLMLLLSGHKHEGQKQKPLCYQNRPACPPASKCFHGDHPLLSKLTWFLHHLLLLCL